MSYFSEELIKQINNAPEAPGVYQYFNAAQKVLYVGKAKNLRKRLKSYIGAAPLTARIFRMMMLAVRVEVMVTKSEKDALLLECNLIKKLLPPYNILLRDDKTFPMVMITKNHQFPLVAKHRGKKTLHAHYFGPFADVSNLNKTIDILKKSFLLRTCSDAEFARREKPCMEYQIKRCSAPCVGNISKKNYDELVREALGFLRGKHSKIQEKLAAEMQLASKAQDYERAAELRDRIRVLSAIQAKQNINLAELGDTDIVALARSGELACLYVAFYRGGNNYGAKPYFISIDTDNSDAEIISAFLGQFYLTTDMPAAILLSHEAQDAELLAETLRKENAARPIITVPKLGEKFRLLKNQLEFAEKYLQQKLANITNHKTMLKQIGELFALPKIPQSIEVYDNSHISGEYAVGALIAVDANGFVKKNYRKFNIRRDELQNYDDTAMLRQVLRRRFGKINLAENSTAENISEKNNRANPAPDLVLIDGGKGQLSAAADVFAELGLQQQFVCISKGPKRNAGEEYFHQIAKESFTLPKDSPLMYYLQQLRDEAHRFAIGTHIQKRAKSISYSQLDEIANIGAARKKILLTHFGSLQAIRDADLEDLARLEGIGRNLAIKIKNYLQNTQ